jgi:hypothetical protein
MDNKQYEMKEGDFVLFANELSEEDKAKNRLGLSGKGIVGGVEKRFVAWTKTSKNGNKFISGNFSDFMKKEADAPAPATQTQDDVPW